MILLHEPGTKRGGTAARTRPRAAAAALAVLASPRDDNPYQEILYTELRKLGVLVTYDEGPTKSQTLNVALAPLMLAWHSWRGNRVLHLHWVFQFHLPWAKQARWARRAMQSWFSAYLRTASLLGYAVVWTAHDLLPHDPVFLDDRRAHQLLARRSDAVIALSEATARELISWGARSVRVVPLGAYALPDLSEGARADARRALGWPPEELVLAHLGKLLPYKGADLLLQAASEVDVRVVVAGECRDPDYAQLLRALAERVGDRALLRLQRLSDEDMARYLLAADAVAFPFREVTNSSSLLLAQCYGLPAIMPDLPELRDVPAAGVLRYDGSLAGLREALSQLGRLPREQRTQMGAAGRQWATRIDWPTAACLTLEAYREAISERAKRAHPPERSLSTSS